jgi:hypothetical protein
VLSIAAESNEQLPSKLTSVSAAIPAFRQCLPSRCLAIDYLSQYYNHSLYSHVLIDKTASEMQEKHSTMLFIIEFISKK